MSASDRIIAQTGELPSLLSEVGGRKFDAGDLGGEADMQVECGWHLAYFGVPLVMRPGSLPASHGLCPDCQSRMEREAGELRQLRMVGDVIASIGERR